jgi:hypothetical protein
MRTTSSVSSGVVRWLNGEAQHRRRSHVDLVDLVRLDLGLDGEAVAVRHDQHPARRRRPS